MPHGGILAELAKGVSEQSQAFFASLVKRCIHLEDTKLVHDHIACHPLHSRSLLLRNHIVHAYARCGSLGHARAAFDAIPSKNVFSWSIIIAAYVRHGHPHQALLLYSSMERAEPRPRPNAFVLSTALAACSALRDLERGEQIHVRIQRERGELGDELVVLDTALLGMYASCGCVSRAEEIFQKMETRDVVAWNAMITAYARAGHCTMTTFLLRVMLLEAAVLPTPTTISAALSGCAHLASGKKLHSLAAAVGVESHPFVAISLLGMYSRCSGSIADAKAVFDCMEAKDRGLVAWNAMIAAYARTDAGDAVALFRAMDVEPDEFTFASVLRVCCDLELGRRVHAQVVATFANSGSVTTSSRLIVDTALLGMYVRCGRLDEAVAVFEKMNERDTVAWNAIIAAYADSGHLASALGCYQRILDDSAMAPNEITYVTLLAACKDLDLGRRLLADARDRGLQVHSAAIGMLARCGLIGEARRLLREAKLRDAVSWNAVISAYALSGQWLKALEVYQEMEHDGSSKPDMFTFASVLAAAAGAGDLGIGTIIHERMVAGNDPVDVSAGNALLSMYSKCGNLDDAKLVFDRIPGKDVVSWNSMISAYARHGRYTDSLLTYLSMNSSPDEATFVSVLAAVSALADLNEGNAIHARVLELGVMTPAVESALMSMHAKCGNLKVARSLFDKMRHRDLVSWNAIVAANAQHGDGAEVFDLIHRMELEGVSPNGVTLSGVLASCSHAGHLDRGMMYVGWLSQEHEMALEREHYRFVVELLGRCGRLTEAEAVVQGMPLEPDPALWMTLVAACKVHEEVAVADRLAGGLDPDDAASYVLLSNLFRNSCT